MIIDSQIGLLIADTDDTQAYIFESSKLPEIRGASDLLDRLNAEIGDLVEAAGGEKIYADGGVLLAVVAGSVAAELVATIEERYPQRTGVATITAGWRPFPPGYNDRQFAEAVTWGRHWLARRKESKGAPPFFQTLSHQERCRSCHKRPAVADYLKSLPDWPICPICFQKRQSKSLWLARYDDEIRRRHPELLRAYYSGTLRNGQLEALTQDPIAPQTVDEIAQASLSRRKYVGLLYLDGDSIGRLLQESVGLEDFCQRSESLRSATHRAVYTALAQHLHPTWVQGSELRQELGQRGKEAAEEVLIHPFEIITMGGDDVLLITPADAALPVAFTIGREFAANMQQAGIRFRDGSPVTMSAGVVLSDDHTPINLLVDLAKQLLREAKVKGGAVDFHILKSADMLDSQVRSTRRRYPYFLEQKRLRLLGRPYGHGKLAYIWQELSVLRRDRFPNSQMNLLAQALLAGRTTSSLFFEYQKQRHGNAYERLEMLLRHLQEPGDDDPLPWKRVRNEPHNYETTLWDIIELYEWV